MITTARIHKSIPTDEHVFVAGMNGTGKSFLCENYLRTYQYVIKLDTKNETEERRREGKSPWTGLVENEDFTVIKSLYDLDTVDTDKIIYCPDFEEQNLDTYDQFFDWVFRRENTIIWIDELMGIGSATTYPINLKRIYTQGRSKNVAVWACTQRPSGIPAISIANSRHFFIFDLMLADDRKKVANITGIPQFLDMPNGYNFWYYHVGDKKAVKAVLKV